MSQAAVDELIHLMDLEPIEVNIFRGSSPKDDRQRVFGGQVAGQALVAAARTVGDERQVHSLHVYFLRPGDPSVPILYEVDRIRDGRSFTTRRVVAIQHGRPIFNLSTSFQVPEEGLEHAFEMPDAPPPESLPTFAERMAPYANMTEDVPREKASMAGRLRDAIDRPRPIDTRLVDWTPLDRARGLPPRQRVWLRADGQLPDDPLLHTMVLTYASDMTLLDTTLLPHGGSWFAPGLFMASLDHAMWFHSSFRADRWLLYSQDTPAASSGRGLARGLVFTQEGELVASVMQEGLIRVVRS